MKKEELIKITPMDTIGIYKIINPDNLVYIGQSTCIKNRLYTYIASNYKSQPKLYNSFFKYGIDNHDFEIIEICDISKLNNRERYWQDHYNVLYGLNATLTKYNNELKQIDKE